MTVLLQERRSVQRRAEHSRIPDALPGGRRVSLLHGPRLCSAPLRSAALRPGHESGVWCTAASTSSLRAQRSNLESFRGGSLDCFVARAPRNDGICGWHRRSSNAHFNRRRAFSSSRLVSPELCFGALPSMKEQLWRSSPASGRPQGWRWRAPAYGGWRP